MSAAIGTVMLASIPSLGKSEVDLTKFVRSDMDFLRLDWSVIRVNANIPHFRHYPHLAGNAVPVCSGCGTSYHKAAGYRTADAYKLAAKHRDRTNEKYSLVLVNLKTKLGFASDLELYYCVACAHDRDTMVKAVPSTHRAGLVYDDGNDVFGFIATAFAQNDANERCRIHQVKFQPDASLVRRIGWPLATLNLRKEIQVNAVTASKAAEQARKDAAKAKAAAKAAKPKEETTG